MTKTKRAMIINFMLVLVLAVLLIFTFNIPSTVNMNLLSKRIKLEQFLQKEFGKKSTGGDVFVAYEVIGNKKRGKVIEIYIWLLCEEYKKVNSRYELGKAVNLPVAIYVKKGNHGYRIIDYKVPETGKQYEASVKEIFPESVQKKIFLSHNACNELTLKLTKQIDEKRLTKFE